MFQNFVSDHRMLIGRKKRQCLCFLQPVEVDQKEETENTSKLEDEIFIWKTAAEVPSNPVFFTKCEFKFFSNFCFRLKFPSKKNNKKTAKSQFPDAHYNVFHYCINSSQEEPKSFDGLDI